MLGGGERKIQLQRKDGERKRHLCLVRKIVGVGHDPW